MCGEDKERIIGWSVEKVRPGWRKGRARVLEAAIGEGQGGRIEED